MSKVKLTDAKVKSAQPPEKGTKDVWDALLPGFGLRITYGGTRTFVLMARVNGKKRRKTIGRYPQISLSDARTRAQDYLQAVERGEDPDADQPAKAKPGPGVLAPSDSFEKVLDRFIANDQKPKNATWWRVERHLRNDVLPRWEGKSVQAITRADVRSVVNDKAAEHPTTANRLRAYIKRFFAYCVENDYLDVNPADGVKAPAPERDRERVLSKAEIRAVWQAFDRLGYPFGDVFKLLLLTGQRRSEVAFMRFRELDLQDFIWHVPADRSKSGNGHEVPLTTTALLVLRNAFPDNLTVDRDALVYRGEKSGDALTAWQRTKAQVDRWSGVRDWTIHDLRRTAATGMAAAGVDKQTISTILNHRESGVTSIYDRYSRFPDVKEALGLWDRRLRRILEEDANDPVGDWRVGPQPKADTPAAIPGIDELRRVMLADPNQ